MNKFTNWAAALVVIGGILLGIAWLRQSQADDEPELSEEITYLCRETGQTIRGSRDNPPTADSIPGCKELVQALYCPRCKKWYPMPPPQALTRMPTGPRCRIHNVGLLEEIPESNDTAQN